MVKEDFLTREDTKIMKAIAVILMLTHHLWTSPDRIAGGELKYLFDICGNSSITLLGGFGKICVSFSSFWEDMGCILVRMEKNMISCLELKKFMFLIGKFL